MPCAGKRLWRQRKAGILSIYWAKFFSIVAKEILNVRKKIMLHAIMENKYFMEKKQLFIVKKEKYCA